MIKFPFILPESLAGYVEAFERNETKSIDSLKKHLKRRGPDAVGYFLLSWLCDQIEDIENRNYYANKAKCCAPGSLFFESLPYFYEHPDEFDAWTPQKTTQKEAIPKSSFDEFYVDIDSLVDRLETINQPTKSTGVQEQIKKIPETDPNSYIATPTLALIYTKQKHYHKAIDVYKKLAAKNTTKKDTYIKKIKKLEDLIDSMNE